MNLKKVKKPRRILVIIGSDSDLPQCLDGLKYLRYKQRQKSCKVVNVITGSIHRNTEQVLSAIRRYRRRVDVIIAGAGMANHLTGTIDAYLRNHLNDDRVAVLGVAFKDDNDESNTQAAISSIKKVPGTQVVFTTEDGMEYIGELGFYNACVMAVERKVFEKISLPKPRLFIERTLEEVIRVAFMA